MASAATTVDEDSPVTEPQRLLSHLAQYLSTELGGKIPVETLYLRAADYRALQEASVSDLLEQGEDKGVYRLVRDGDAALRVTNVNPIGECPPELEQFSGTDEQPASFAAIDGIGETTAQRLRQAGFDSFGALHAAEPAALTDIPTMTSAKAKHIIEQAGRFMPVAHHLVQETLDRYQHHHERWGTAGAIVRDILDIEQDVGEPLAMTDPTVPTDNTHYHGLPVLTDTDHPHMVRAAAFPHTDGEPIAPKSTTMDTVSLDTVTATAQKLARGNRGLRLVGPHGCGKNYTLRYIHYRTNRVLVSIDADSSMVAQDVLGISSVDENRIVTFQDGVLTKAMKHGYTLVINEANVAPPGIMMALQEVLNRNVLTVKESGEEIIPHPAARIVITMNPPTREYRGTEPQNAATRDRFQTIYYDYLAPDDEVNLLDQLANASRQRIARDDIRRLVEVANATRSNATWPTLSPRKLNHAIEWVDDGASVRGALKHVVQAAAEPHQTPADTYDTIEDV